MTRQEAQAASWSRESVVLLLYVVSTMQRDPIATPLFQHSVMSNCNPLRTGAFKDGWAVQYQRNPGPFLGRRRDRSTKTRHGPNR
jgi:hypothetical protein